MKTIPDIGGFSAKVIDLAKKRLTKRGGGLLACKADGFVFRAMVVGKENGAIKVYGEALSRELDFYKAIEDCIAQLKEQDVAVPSKACLVTPAVVPALLDLPVTPDDPRPKQQMEELIRWEMEPIIAQQNDQWVIGVILQGRGYISNQERRDVAVAVELATSAAGGKGTARFGEMAIEEGFISREQLDECLLLQEKMVVVDDNIACGWSMQTQTDADGSERVAWFTCAISATLRRAWVNAFSRHKIKLRWFYPEVGATIAAIEDEEGADQNRVVLEVHQEQLACFRTATGNVAAMQVEPRIIGQLNVDSCVDVCHDQMRPGIQRLHITPEGKDLAAELAVRLNRDVITLPASKNTLVGAAAHALGLRAPQILPRIASEETKGKYSVSGDVMRGAAVVAVLTAMIGTEGYLRVTGINAENELARLEQEYDDRMAEKKRVQTFTSEISQLEDLLREKEQRLGRASHELDVIENILLARGRLVPGVLEKLRESVSEEVVIDSLQEANNKLGYFTLEAWALNNTSAQLFVTKLNRELAEWDLSVVDENISSARGRLGLSGYAVSLSIVPGKRVDRNSDASTPGGA